MKRLVLVALALCLAPAQAAPKKMPMVVRSRDWSTLVVATPAGDARMGSPNAPVRLIEYGSRTCPHCAHFDIEGVPALKAGYVASGNVSYEFRDYPIHDALDLGPILVGRCLPAAQFFPMLDAMMVGQDGLIGRADEMPAADQARLAKATPNVVAAYLAKFYGYSDLAIRRGVPVARLRACLADPKAIAAIVRRANFANRTYKLNSTPTFIVNGKVAAGAYDWTTLEPVLRAAGAK